MREIVLLFIAFASFFLIQACGNPSEGSSVGALNIELEIADAPDMPVYLGGIYGEQYFNIDSFGLENGVANISRTEPLAPGMYFLVLPQYSINIQILVDKDQNFQLKTSINDPIGQMKVSGSEDNEALYEGLKFQQSYQTEYNRIRQQLQGLSESDPGYAALEQARQDKVNERKAHLDDLFDRYANTFFVSFKKAGQNPEFRDVRLPNGEVDLSKQTYYYINDYWTDYDFGDERMLRTPVYHNKLNSFFGRLMPQNADTIIKYADWVTRQSMAHDSVFKYTANYIGIKYKEPTFMGSDAVYAHMVQNFFTDDLAFWATEYEIDRLQQDAAIIASSKLNVPAKNIQVIDLDGNPISLLDTKAELIVLYFYSPECENCQKETPQLKNVYNQWKDRGIEVFAITIEPDESGWRNYVVPNYTDWINGFDPNNGAAYNFKYHIDVTPEIYVIDQERKIVGKDLKAFQLPTIFERHL